MITLLAFTGGLILLRVLLNRVKAEGRNQLNVRLLDAEKFGARPEAVWLAASVCLTMPILLMGSGHYLAEATPESGKVALWLFPFWVG